MKNLPTKSFSFSSIFLKKIAKYKPKVMRQIFSNLKDNITEMSKKDVIFQLECLKCNGKYIGQTDQWIKQRITGHKSDCRLMKNSCAVVEHFKITGHYLDFSNSKLLE